MTSMSEHPSTPAGISVRTLALAIALTAVLTGAGAWLWLRPVSDPTTAADTHADELPSGVVELPVDAMKNAGLAIAEVTARRLPTTIDVTGNIAQVKVELDYPSVKFTDHFSMVETKGTWLIVNKTYYAERK